MSEINKQIQQKDTNIIDFDLTPKQDVSYTLSASQQTQQLRRSEQHSKGVQPDRFAYAFRNDPVYELKCWQYMLNIEKPRDKNNWTHDTRSEINSLQENETWTLVNPPQEARVI